MPAMTEGPINVFGSSSDSRGIAEFVHRQLDGSTLEADGSGWAVVVGDRQRLRRSVDERIRVNVSTDYFAGESGRQQAAGFVNYLRGGFGGPGLDHVVAQIPGFRVAVAIIVSDDTADMGGLMRLAGTIAEVADGVVLRLDQGCVWAANGTVLASVDLVDADADAAAGAPSVAAPPHRDRVAARLAVLLAVAERGMAEGDGQYVHEARTGIVGWFDGLGGLHARGEAEPVELRIIDAPAGSLDQDDCVNGSWRIEGAAVLAWALGLVDLVDHLREVDVDGLRDTIGFPDPTAGTARLAATSLRSHTEIEQLADRLFAVHWRLRQYSLGPKSMNFAEFATTAWFGPLDITGLELGPDGDLAIGGVSIHHASADALRVATSTVSERHLAANWLRDGGLYSHTDTST